MLATIKKYLAILDFITFVLFLVVFGVLLYSKTILGSIAILSIPIGIIFIKYKECMYTRFRKIPLEDMKGNPVVDCIIVIYAIQEYINWGTWNVLYTIGLIMASVDLLLWVVTIFDKIKQ